MSDHTTPRPMPRFVHVIWCEDVRSEVGNKGSLMGVFSGRLVVGNKPPVTLPKICAHVTIQTPIDQPFGSLKLRIIRNDDDEALAAIEATQEEISSSADQTMELNSALASEPPSVLQTTLIAVMGPLEIRDTTKWLQAVVDMDDDTMESTKLHITTL